MVINFSKSISGEQTTSVFSSKGVTPTLKSPKLSGLGKKTSVEKSRTKSKPFAAKKFLATSKDNSDLPYDPESEPIQPTSKFVLPSGKYFA